MKKTILVSSMLFALTLSATIQAQDTEKKESEEGFVFTTVKENPITSVKNQIVRARAGATPHTLSWSLSCFVWEG